MARLPGLHVRFFPCTLQICFTSYLIEFVVLLVLLVALTEREYAGEKERHSCMVLSALVGKHRLLKRFSRQHPMVPRVV